MNTNANTNIENKGMHGYRTIGMIVAMGVVAMAAGCEMQDGPAEGQDETAVKAGIAPIWPQRPPDAIYTFSTETDVIAMTMASDGLFAGIPVGIDGLDEPAIHNGFIGSARLYESGGPLVGFATKHEEFLPPSPTSLSTFTLTLPGRGTLFIEGVQDVEPFYDQLWDMLASGDLVRTFDPPLTVVSTVPRTGRIVGGSGEFARVRGVWRETQALHELDLIERRHVDTITLELWMRP